jgi:hypothetical protein
LGSSLHTETWMRVNPEQPISPRHTDCEARKEHLVELGPIHDLLKALNDPYSGGTRVTTLVSQIPLLAHRCVQALLVKRPTLRAATLNQALALLGNRGLETELLQVLEDLTVLRSELDADVG